MRHISKIMALALILTALFAMAAVLPEPWNTVLFVIAIPLLVQIIKLIKDKGGVAFSKMANQIISLVLTVIFTLLSGGFAGLPIPAWPGFGGDLILFIGDLLGYIGAWAALIGAAWGSMMVLYEAVWDKLFTAFGFATADKY